MVFMGISSNLLWILGTPASRAGLTNSLPQRHIAGRTCCDGAHTISHRQEVAQKRKAPLARGFYISTISKRLQAAVSRQVLGDHGRAVSRGAARSRVDTHDGLLAAGPHHVAVAGRGGHAANGRTDVQAQAVDVRVRLER